MSKYEVFVVFVMIKPAQPKWLQQTAGTFQALETAYSIELSVKCDWQLKKAQIFFVTL